MAPKHVLSLWQQKKISHESAVCELLRTRCRGVEHFVGVVEYVRNQEVQHEMDEQMQIVKKSLACLTRPFIQHPMVNDWKLQFRPEMFGKLHRYQMLCLRGKSQTGKSMFAKSLFGVQHTLVLNCQRHTTSLPSMRHFSRDVHRAILLDEVTVAQVLEFKALLQSTAEKIQLGQSQCGQHRYEVWVYGIAWILASNDFDMDERPGVLSAEDSEWLKKNIVCVELPDGMTWFQQGADVE